MSTNGMVKAVECQLKKRRPLEVGGEGASSSCHQFAVAGGKALPKHATIPCGPPTGQIIAMVAKFNLPV